VQPPYRPLQLCSRSKNTTRGSETTMHADDGRVRNKKVVRAICVEPSSAPSRCHRFKTMADVINWSSPRKGGRRKGRQKHEPNKVQRTHNTCPKSSSRRLIFNNLFAYFRLGSQAQRHFSECPRNDNIWARKTGRPALYCHIVYHVVLLLPICFRMEA
jgi:hypothetical protein